MAKKFARGLAMLLVLATLFSVISIGAFAAETFPIDKTANGLDENDQTDVTLTVPGAFEGNIDVVFILGGGMTANMETIQSAINVFKPSMESGKATVRMGLISLEKGQEIILDLNSDEAVLDPSTYVDFVTAKFDSINDLPGGTTNLHSQLLEAQKMLARETEADPENKYVFVLATGRTYWFDADNGEQATIVNKVSGTYYWADYLWRSQRGRHTSLYMIPDRYNDSYEAFFADVEQWVAADGDTYAFTPHFDANDPYAYANWYAKNNQDLRALGIAGSRYGLGIVDPVPTAENFITGVPAAIGSENHPLHALNYERAHYECVQVWKQLVAEGYNCYSICSESPNYQNGSEYIKQGAGYTGTSTTQLGHSFMNYLATLAGQAEAPTVWDYERDAEGNFLSANTVLQENFFESVRDDILYSTSIGSTVEDFIGKNDNGNFEFIENPEYITLNVGGASYSTDMIEDTEEGSKYTFTAPGATEPTFWLEYYYGDSETTERFVWTFGENVSSEKLASLTYKLQLTEKQEVAGTYEVPTNNSATLYPVDSDGNEGDPQLFPVPEVEYTVAEPETPPTEPNTPPTVSYNPGEASNISFLLIDADGNVEFLAKYDTDDQTSFEIPTEEGKISAVFVKQGNAQGLFWASQELSEELWQDVIDCVDENNPSFKGYTEKAFGEGEHSFEFKNGKMITYKFEGDIAEVMNEASTVEEPVVEEPIVEEPVVEEPVVEEPVVEEPIVEEPIVEEPIVEEPIVEEPIVDESIVEDPVVEEPVEEEPVEEETPDENVEETDSKKADKKDKKDKKNKK